ncbi:UNVERIFIED_CONTAM: hypothetical protein FKN15_002092 [Acipenser sinensis]
MPNEIGVDQTVFQMRLRKGLRKHPRYPNIVQEFITGLESYMEDQEKFKNCLLPCALLSAEGESSAGEDGLNIPRIIINQFKWLDRVMDSKDLASKLMQLVAVAPVEIQRDIITSLPEILEDTQHNDIAKELNSLLQKNTQLTVPILDALSSLNLSSDLLAEVRQAVMATLSAVELEDLPVVVKFILHAISGAEAVEVVSDLRKKLELESCVLPPPLQASQSRAKSRGKGGAGEDGLNIPRIIINQFKWLDRVMDSKDLASKLMQLVAVAPVEIQRDIITSLPEILEDTQHNDIAKELNSLLQKNTQLTVPILDALSSLNLSSDLLAEVRQAVMATLSAVELEDLPVVVKFILHAISGAEAVEVVSDLRKKLELESCVLPPPLQASRSRGKSRGKGGSSLNSAASSSQDCVSLVLDAIKSAVRFQKAISEAWIKAIENIDSVAEHKVIDLLVLFILHTTNSNHSRRGAERVLRNKVRGGHIRESLLQAAFRGHTTVIRAYFPSIISLAQSLLRSPDPSVVTFGSQMYKHAFTSFDPYCQQEVVGSLVTHVCSGYAGEVDVSLEVLSELVTQSPADMALYAVFVKDDMHIVIRKQLSSTVSKYKRIGIIGAVMVVGSMATRRYETGRKIQDHPILSAPQHRVTALLGLVRSCSECSPEAAALYYDELANLVQTGDLDPQVHEWIGMSVLEDFQEDFVVDLGPEIKGTFPLPAKAMYNLDEEESQGGIAINLLPLLAEDLQKGAQLSRPAQGDKRRVSPLCLGSFFRLLRLCQEEQNQGDLVEIDALLGCPLIVTDLDVVEKMDCLSKPEKEFLCTLLFHAINWIREVVNAFCRQQDPEMKSKVMIRLQNITYLQSVLERCLAATPAYAPPLANFDCETAEGAVPASAAPPAKKEKKGRAGQKRKVDKNSSGDSSQLEEGAEAEESQQEKESPEKEKEKEEGKAGVSLVSYRPYFRELDIDVLSVLQCGLLLDSEDHTKVSEVVQLGPSELVFLLEDLSRKLEFSLAASNAKRMPFLKVKADKNVGFSHLQQKSPSEIASCCIQLLPALCNHLENTHNFFQVLLLENNGVVDAPGVDMKEYQLMSTCYQLLLHILLTTFSWSGFSQHENRKLLKSALAILAGRLKEKENEVDLGMEELVRGFLCQEWILPSGEREKGNKHNEMLQSLLSIYLEHTDDVLKVIEEIAGVGFPELISTTKGGCSRTFPTLTRQTFLVFYRVVMGVLEKSVRRIAAGKQMDSSEAQSEKLLTWNLAVRDFHILINLVKVFDSRPVLGVCLRYGRLFVEAFLKLAMPLLDYSFKKHKEDVQSLLKTFQQSTRQLHYMCGHTKIRQDTGLTNHVPLLKKTLEQFVYRVKAMLILNNCQEAFWVGNLKNRNLKGEEILSQQTEDSEKGEDDEASQLPEEESEREVWLLGFLYSISSFSCSTDTFYIEICCALPTFY